MEQVGDKPEEVRKHLEEEQAQPGEKQPPRHPERQDGETAASGSGDESENAPTDR
ncbi:hypothetical protein [Streptomyces sp. NPDC088760]|uniref:hypothetical protein n=1 Tax=Streptomyces sp. NPDC088760 TaxID=3365890 RepID=UPI003829D3FE